MRSEHCFTAMRAKDPRFDGWFFTAVTTTGIYCRPSCPAVTPKEEYVRFYPTAAAAQAAGFRACKRCRPDAAPGSPEWDLRSDVVARAVRLIRDGVVDSEGVGGLADRLGYNRRQLERMLRAELGASPLGLARAQRAQTARFLVETTDLTFLEVAIAAGFGSVRQFNDVVRDVFAMTPSMLRSQSKPPEVPGRGTLTLRLAFRPPLLPDNLFGHLVATGVPGVEEWREGSYRRTLRLPHGTGLVGLAPRPTHVQCRLMLGDLRDLQTAISRCRRLLDLDADPQAVDAHLATDLLLEPLVTRAPGRRVPRTVDPEELALRAVLGQQVSTGAARTHAARLAALLGEVVEDPAGGLNRVFPTAQAIAEIDPALLALPRSRCHGLVGLARALVSGEVDLGPGVDREHARASLLALRGVGPWTAETIAMRALGDPDAFPASDLGVARAARMLGINHLAEQAERWRPWRAYGVQHLWSLGRHPINDLPEEDVA